jgi:branched-chain amino acid transport system substrate-binding protein
VIREVVTSLVGVTTPFFAPHPSDASTPIQRKGSGMSKGVAKIAFLAPLTGPEAIVGVPMMHAVALAVEKARDTLPFDVSFLALDDEADPARARSLAEGLVEDLDVIGVVGHKNSGPSAAAGPVYAAAGVTQVTPSSTNSGLARQGWPTFFRVCADNDRQAAVAAHHALEHLGVRRIAAVHDDTDYGRPLAACFASTIQEAGAEVALVESVRLGQRSFDDTVHRLREVACDLAYFGLTEIESSFLIRALRSAHVSAHFFGADGGRQSPFPRLAGEAAEGVYESYAGADAQESPRAQRFLAEYGRRHGDCPIFGLEAYDAGCLLMEALRRAGEPRREAVLAEMRRLDGFAGVSGPVYWEPDGNRRDATVTIWQVIHGEMTLRSGQVPDEKPRGDTK